MAGRQRRLSANSCVSPPLVSAQKIAPPNSLLHCGISVASGAEFMSVTGLRVEMSWSQDLPVIPRDRQYQASAISDALSLEASLAFAPYSVVVPLCIGDAQRNSRRCMIS